MKWPTVNLLDLCSPKQWPTISSKQLTEKGYPVYGANGQIGFYHSYNHEEPTILITCRGATCGTINISPPKSYVTGNAMALDNPRANLIEFRFLYYVLQVRGLKDTITGAAQPQITRANLSKLEIPLPSISEQKRIVEILDQADALRKKRSEADAKAARILPALFYKMFGDPLIIMVSDKSIPLGQMDIEIQNGFACGEKNVTDGVPHLRMNNIDDSGVLNLDLIRTVPEDRDEERYRLRSGEVLFMGTNSEDKVGKSCVFYPPDNRHYLFSNHLVRIRVRDLRITPEFLSSFLHLLWGKKFYPPIAKRWVNQASVAQDALMRIRVPIPQRQL
jgi:Restriction endonuclease S subunits